LILVRDDGTVVRDDDGIFRTLCGADVGRGTLAAGGKLCPRCRAIERVMS
jgi:hypothetical protein